MGKMTFVESTSGVIFETSHPEWHKDVTVLTRAEGMRKRKEYALRELCDALRPGDTVHSVLRHVSASGMSRRVDFYVIKEGRLQFLTGWISAALGYKWGDKAGLTVGGCGMDMGFHVVYHLGRALWPDGTPEPHGTRNGEPDTDGGYALKHEWI